MNYKPNICENFENKLLTSTSSKLGFQKPKHREDFKIVLAMNSI